jgi:hypothetical protein
VFSKLKTINSNISRSVVIYSTRRLYHLVSYLFLSLLIVKTLYFFHGPRDSSDIKVGLNGFGRIGRLVFRCGLEEGIQVVAVNG